MDARPAVAAAAHLPPTPAIERLRLAAQGRAEADPVDVTAFTADVLATAAEMVRVPPAAVLTSDRGPAAVVRQVRASLDFTIFESELQAVARPSDLGAFLLRELNEHARLLGGRAPAKPAVPTIPPPPPARAEPVTRQLESALFVLSAPRSGSSLLRRMVGVLGNIYAPSEFCLLMFRSCVELTELLQSRSERLRLSGVVDAIRVAYGSGEQEAHAVIRRFAAAGQTVADLYRDIQDRLTPRLLVDKTPAYALNPLALARMAGWFAAPRCIHLVRHPVPVIESFVTNRFHKLYAGHEAYDPYTIAEWVWRASHQNIHDFLAAGPAFRFSLLRYEDLVADPGATGRQLCRDLGLAYRENFTQPYAVAADGALGDPRGFRRTRIEAAAAWAWRDAGRRWRPGAPTIELAAALGYAPLD